MMGDDERVAILKERRESFDRGYYVGFRQGERKARLRIRRAQRKALATLRGKTWTTRELDAIDAATRAPRKKGGR